MTENKWTAEDVQSLLRLLHKEKRLKGKFIQFLFTGFTHHVEKYLAGSANMQDFSLTVLLRECMLRIHDVPLHLRCLIDQNVGYPDIFF